MAVPLLREGGKALPFFGFPIIIIIFFCNNKNEKSMDMFVFLRVVGHDRVVGHIVHLRVDVLLLIPRSTTTDSQR